MTREDYKKSRAFRVAVKWLWVKLLFVLLAASALGGWFSRDIMALSQVPVVQSSLGQFMGVSAVVYVAANLVICLLTGGRGCK